MIIAVGGADGIGGDNHGRDGIFTRKWRSDCRVDDKAVEIEKHIRFKISEADSMWSVR